MRGCGSAAITLTEHSECAQWLDGFRKQLPSSRITARMARQAIYPQMECINSRPRLKRRAVMNRTESKNEMVLKIAVFLAMIGSLVGCGGVSSSSPCGGGA